jgi:subtilisin-like proprotein convertase family protein
MNESQNASQPVFPPPIPRSPLLAGIAALALFAGVATANAATYSNSNAVTIPGFASATPYPAAISVTGLTGTVTDVDVRLNDVTHGMLDDVAVALQAPSGQSMMLMDGAGSAGVSHVTLTIDDEAAAQFNSSGSPATGSYRPAQFYSNDSFPAPGPGAGYCNPGPVSGGSCTLSSAFDGSNPIGTWRLFVIDTLGTSSGTIAGGWSLDIQTNGPADFDAPQTAIDSGPTGTIDTSSATFTFSASEQAGFDCKLDGGAYSPCGSPAIYTALADGPHTFAVRATDPAGNVDASPATRSFTVDTSASTTGPTTGPGPGPSTDPTTGPVATGADTAGPVVAIGKATVKRAKRAATVTFTATDETTPAAQLRSTCSLDGGAAAPCSSPVTFKRLKAGRHTLVVQATDAAGNRSEAATATFRVKPKR